MGPTHVLAKEIPGTKIHLVKRANGNPARETKDIPLFKNGYWEVHMSSTGKHPDFLEGWWKILLVTPAKPRITFEINTQSGLWFIPVSPDVRPVSLQTFINCIEYGGTWWRFPAFIIILSDGNVVRIQCGDIKPAGSRAIN
jgi:hypothetical protein